VSAERARSFGSVAEDYDATRAGWPLEPFVIAFEHFGAPERPDVADLAAGTGKLTRTLAKLAGTLVAVEPDADLRAVLQREQPRVRVLDGTAELLPLPTASADVVCAGQAFHWFDVDRALAEIRRVLRSQGVMIAGWNVPPEDGTWYDAVVEYLHVANPDHLPARTQDWAAVFGAQPGFTGLLEISARHEQGIERAAFRRLLGTHSAINVLPSARRAELLDHSVAVADAHGAFDGEGRGVIAWRCDLFAMQRSS
jgi:SAM-dependent methyltransferase